jgi:hypothetical protein
MKNKRHESKLAAKIDEVDRNQRATKEKETKNRKVSGRPSQDLRPIGEDLSSQYEEAENELEKVGRGPAK